MCMSSTLRLFRTTLLIAGATLGSALTPAGAEELPAELEELKAALEKYQDPLVAVRDGYFSTLGCVEYETGGMGIHFLNPALIGPEPDPMRPALLLYEPDGEELRLVAVEWFVPLATGIKSRPELYGQPFDGPMEGHEPLIPAELHHYDLHAWLFKPNPAGVFNAVNPDVDCPEGRFTLAEQPPATVPHPGAE